MSEIKEKVENKKQEISITKIATVLGILIPVFYAFGYFYDLGYLSEYGLSSEYFTRSHQEYLFKFYYILISTITGVFSLDYGDVILIYGLFFISVFLFFFFNEEVNKERESPVFIKNIIKKINLKNSITSSLKKTTGFLIDSLFGILILYVLTVILSLLVLPMAKGQKDARKEINSYVECIEGKPHKQNCTYVYSRNKERVLSGSLIAKSDKYIAIWNGKKSIVYTLKDETIVVERAKEGILKKK